VVYANDVNIVDKNINIIKKNKKALLQASREIGLRSKYTEHQVYVWLSRH
jgi:hypothetical protein